MTKCNQYKVLIIVCWSLLGLCCIVKLFGANIFIASTENSKFIEICQYVDAHFWLQCLVMSIFNLASCSIYYMAVLKEKKPSLNSLKWLLPLIPYIVLKQIFYQQVILFFITDIFMMIGLPILINRKVWYWSIISFIATLTFQLISAFLKLDNYTRFDNSVLVGILLSIDYYIMLILYYLYRIRRYKEGDEAK